MQDITSNFVIEIYSGATSTWADYTAYSLAGSLNIDHELNTRSVCTLKLYDYDSTMTMPSVGQRVRVTDGANAYFGGLIETVEYQAFRPGGEPQFNVSIKATDWTALLDRFYVTETFEDSTLRSIVLNIIAKMPTADQLDTTNVDTGPVLTKVVFPTLTGQECLDELMRETGYKYWVTYDKKLYVKDRFGSAASWQLTDATAPTRTVGVPIVKRDKSQYRNRQEVKGATTPDDANGFYPAPADGGMISMQTGDKFYTPSTIAATIAEPLWDLGRPVSSIDRVYVKATPITADDYGDVYVCSVKGGQNTSPFYYVEGSRYLYLNESWVSNGTTYNWWEVFPAGAYRYVMVYGKFKSEAAAIRDKTATWCAGNGEAEVDTIAQMAAIEGGSGIYHKIEVNERLTTVAQCEARANALLKAYGIVPTIIDYASDDWDDLMVGQYQNVTIYGLNKDCVVKSIKISDMAGRWLRAQIQLVGSERQSYAQYWRQVLSGKTAAMANTYAIRQNEVATEYDYMDAEDIILVETLTATEITPGTTWGDYAIGAGAEWA